jgi:V-type H+-transporting ATPase subunit a
MERRLELVRRELVRDEIEIQDVTETPRHPTAREINDLEALIERNEQEIMELTENFSHLLDNQRTLVEYRSVLETAEVFFNEGTSIVANGEDENRQLHYVAGTVNVEKFHGFERMLWRISHGNVFVKHQVIETPFKDYKNVRKLRDFSIILN